MPRYYYYVCDKCRFSPKRLKSGSFNGSTMRPMPNGYTYVTDDAGNRIICGHPCEALHIGEVLGKDAPIELIEQRTGYINYCVCLDCLADLEIDLKRDPRLCPNCKSNRVVKLREMVGTTCPKCKSGTFKELDSGIIS